MGGGTDHMICSSVFRRHAPLVLLAVLLASFDLGCKDSITQPAGNRIVSGLGGTSTRDVAAYVWADRSNVLRLVEGKEVSIVGSAVAATFLDTATHLTASAGALMFNATAVDRVPGSFAYSLENAPIAADGVMNHVVVSGSSEFPPLVDSVRSPTGETVILAPGFREAVSRRTGFAIRWNPGKADTVLVTLLPGDLSQPRIERLVPNSGLFWVAPEEFRSWPNGLVGIGLFRINYVRRSLASTKLDYLVAVHYSHGIDATLGD